MIRELIDIAVLEDFLSGLSAASGLQTAVFSPRGRLICACPGGQEPRSGPRLERLPQRLAMTKLLPAHEPPANVAVIEQEGLAWLVVPVYINQKVGGFVALGPFRSDDPVQTPTDELDDTLAWPPRLERRGDTLPVVLGRWASRLLAAWCLNEARLDVAAEELALLGDIGELLSGEQDLQTVLDHIVERTARVMNLKYCSLRLYDPATDKLTVRAGYNVSERYHDELTLLRSENPIDDQALRGELVYIEDARTDPRVRFDEAKRLNVVSGLVAGMIYRGEPVGVLRVYADHRKRFRSQQRKLLRAVAAQAAVAVVNSRLFSERLRSALLERQLKTAGAVQERMTRQPPPEHPRVQSARVFEPSSHVGGDFCDIFALSDGRLAAVVGDVVGHGMPAALLMASARAALRSAARYCSDLGRLAAQLNAHILAETASSEFVTMLLVTVDARGRELRFVNAGHEPLILLRERRIRQPGAGDLPLGIEPGETYHEHVLALSPGDFVLLYTDGLIEAANYDEEMFGRGRLAKALREVDTGNPDFALGAILWEVKRFTGLAEQSDDITMVGLKIR